MTSKNNMIKKSLIMDQTTKPSMKMMSKQIVDLISNSEDLKKPMKV